MIQTFFNTDKQGNYLDARRIQGQAQMNRLVGIGECMIELSQADEGLLRKSFAGDVFNTLYYANLTLQNSGRTDWQTSFYSSVGTDPASGEMLEFISGAGVDISLTGKVQNRRPGLYMIHLDKGERSFSYWRETSAARLLAADRKALDKAVTAANALYFSGITLAILPEVDREVFLECLDQARRDGKLIVFDPNIRPALWTDSDTMKAAIHEAAGYSSLILPSFDDEASAFGDGSPEETIERYAHNNAGMIVVKNGAGGIVVSDTDRQIRAFETRPVENPVDTTGAGDSFNGAFLGEFLVSRNVEKAVRAGQDCAAQVICHHGALIKKSDLFYHSN